MNLSMQQIREWGRVLYLVAMGAVGIQQLFYGQLVNLIGPSWPAPFAGYTVLVYLFSGYLVALCLAALAGSHVNRQLFILGCILLAIDMASQVPFLYLVLPYKKSHLGVWVHVLKELALAGGAFITARVTWGDQAYNDQVIPETGVLGPLFFAITMTCFGCAHFLYADATATLVPPWIPGALFWVYITGAALIAAGIAIASRTLTFWAALLLGGMIFLWFWIIHLPSAIVHSTENQGNEISAALSALAFSGIAFMIAGSAQRQSAVMTTHHKAWL